MEAVLTRTKLKTVTLQDLVSRAVKGSTMVDIIPLSCLMQITVKDKKLTIKSTDNINFVTVYADVEDTSDFSMVVQSKQFAQIVSKLTTEYTEISVEGSKVQIKANGTYSMSLSVDADGTVIEFPEPTFESTGSSLQITNEEIKSILSYNKSCKADMKEIPAYFNYYMDKDGVLTTNTYKGCYNPVKVFETPVALTPNVVELIAAVADDSGVTVSQTEDLVMFTSTVGTLVAKKCLPADLEAFPGEALKKVITSPLGSVVTLNRTMFISALERMCLFTDPLESNKLVLTFTPENLKLYSAYTDSTEYISYARSAEEAPYSFESISLDLDGDYLKSQISACDKESIKVAFADKGIQIHIGSIIMMLAILQDADVQ